MKATEAAALLTVAAAFDNRKADADAAQAWAIALDGLNFEDCRSAVVAHFRVSSDWLMPQAVIAGVKRIRDKRIADYGPIPPPPGMDPDDVAAVMEWNRNATRDIADGNPPEQPTVIGIPVPDAIKELRRKAERDVREGMTGPPVPVKAELCRHGVARDRCAEHDPRRATIPPSPADVPDQVEESKHG